MATPRMRWSRSPLGSSAVQSSGARTAANLLGPYRIKNLSVDVKAVVTNKMPNAPYRGAGRPEVVFAIERAVDCLARELGIDPADVRRRNFVRPEEMPYEVGMPYRDGNPLVYDS